MFKTGFAVEDSISIFWKKIKTKLKTTHLLIVFYEAVSDGWGRYVYPD